MAIKQRKAGRTSGVGTEQTETTGKKTSGKSGGWSPATLMMVAVCSEPHTRLHTVVCSSCESCIAGPGTFASSCHPTSCPCACDSSELKDKRLRSRSAMHHLNACLCLCGRQHDHFFWPIGKRLTRHPVLVVSCTLYRWVCGWWLGVPSQPTG
jgi:hypothetical protein